MLEEWGEAWKGGAEEVERWEEREERWMPEEGFVFFSIVPFRKRPSCTSQR